jgi:hypothetical protein
VYVEAGEPQGNVEVVVVVIVTGGADSKMSAPLLNPPPCLRNSSNMYGGTLTQTLFASQNSVMLLRAPICKLVGFELEIVNPDLQDCPPEN